jgi:hypothetical protein
MRLIAAFVLAIMSISIGANALHNENILAAKGWFSSAVWLTIIIGYELKKQKNP